jgi:hypothetical protein
MLSGLSNHAIGGDVRNWLQIYLGVLYVIGGIICFLNRSWIAGILFLLNIPLWSFLIKRDPRLMMLARLSVIPLALLAVIVINPLLPSVPGQPAPRWDSSSDLVLWISLGVLTLFGVILALISLAQRAK